ncbi:hypothetical protein M501DRAFT_607682 [Patellaria atrata CBS 101060]|uniref:Uncharacterized protein n=1 Tax=Patellaria atrata CBS 101060 TaxID=1346257 RepID=A0A9P4VT52_9PEZI|nr:hypothetical protein M501DRAFT_607682 [Patellaria atrata CBS 101060]
MSCCITIIIATTAYTALIRSYRQPASVCLELRSGRRSSSPRKLAPSRPIWDSVFPVSSSCSLSEGKHTIPFNFAVTPVTPDGVPSSFSLFLYLMLSNTYVTPSGHTASIGSKLQLCSKNSLKFRIHQVQAMQTKKKQNYVNPTSAAVAPARICTAVRLFGDGAMRCDARCRVSCYIYRARDCATHECPK